LGASPECEATVWERQKNFDAGSTQYTLTEELGQLQLSAVAPRMYIVINRFEFDPLENAITYSIEMGIEE
jgi:hypothetical protein